MQTNYIEKITSEIQQHLSLTQPITIDTLDKGTEAICFRTMPSANSRFYEGGRLKEIEFQILVKSKSQFSALTTIQKITDYLEGLDCTITVEPNFLQKDSEAWIYQASFHDYIN